MIYAYGFMSCVHRTLKTMVPVMEGMSRRSGTSGDTDGGGKGYALEKVDESKLDLEVPTLLSFRKINPFYYEEVKFMGAMKNFITEVWNLYSDGYSVREIAYRYGCSESDVRHAIWTFIEYGMEETR